MTKQFNGTESMKEIRQFIKVNKLEIKTTGKGRNKFNIIKDINNLFSKQNRKNTQKTPKTPKTPKTQKNHKKQAENGDGKFIDLDKTKLKLTAKIKFDDPEQERNDIIRCHKNSTWEVHGKPEQVPGEQFIITDYKQKKNESIHFQYVLFQKLTEQNEIRILDLAEYEEKFDITFKKNGNIYGTSEMNEDFKPEWTDVFDEDNVESFIQVQAVSVINNKSKVIACRDILFDVDALFLSPE